MMTWNYNNNNNNNNNNDDDKNNNLSVKVSLSSIWTHNIPHTVQIHSELSYLNDDKMIWQRNVLQRSSDHNAFKSLPGRLQLGKPNPFFPHFFYFHSFGFYCCLPQLPIWYTYIFITYYLSIYLSIYLFIYLSIYLNSSFEGAFIYFLSALILQEHTSMISSTAFVFYH